MTDSSRISIGRTSLLAMSLAATSTGVLAHGDKLPLGDGNVSNSPKKGYVMSCQQRFNPNAGGAHREGEWIRNGYWYPDEKPTVDGNVKWSGGGVKVSINGATRKITTSGVPTHTTGVYPIRRSDDAYQYDRNPGRISKRRVSLNLPAEPQVARSASCVPMGMIGVAITGVAIYNALDGRGDDAPAHEIQDKCNGHPQREGQYHYHNKSDCMTEVGRASNGHSGLVGYALDGFGIYGSNGAGGKHMSNANLDACHGHTETVVWDGKVRKMYHYHLTDEYPYTLGCFKGTPVSNGTRQGGGLFSTSSNRKPQPGQQQGAFGQPPKRQLGGQNDPLAIAAAELGIPLATLRAAVGPPPPNFRQAAQKLGISENKLRRAMEKARRQSGL